MNLVRKVVTVIEDTMIEGRKTVPRPFRMVALKHRSKPAKARAPIF